MSELEGQCAEFDRAVLVAILTAVSPVPLKAAHDILNHFPSFQHAVRADQSILTEIIGEKGARLIKTIPSAVASMTRETAMNAASYILTLNAAREHFSALLNGRREEALAVIYLNAKNRMIDDEVREGSIDRINIFPREIVRRAILLDASGLLIAHNHPSGDPTPSSNDLIQTANLEKTLEIVDIVLLDHIIFGEGNPYSLRANGDF